MSTTSAPALFLAPEPPRASRGSALSNTRILLAEADSRHLLAVEAALMRHGAEVTLARTLRGARVHLRAPARPFDAAVVAFSLPGGRGSILVDELRRQGTPCLAVLRSEQGDRTSASEILGAGAVELLLSTDRVDVVVGAVERAVAATRRLRAQLDAIDIVQTPARDRGAEPERPVRLAAHSVPAVLPKTRAMDLESAVLSLAKAVQLSPREQAVLRLIALGYRYRDIGVALEISTRTVKMHATNMRRKVGVGSRHELLREMFEGQGASCR